MDKMIEQVRSKYDFLKEQAESYALAVGYFTASMLCFKYMEKLFYVFGIISGVSLLLVSIAICVRNINEAENLFRKDGSSENKLRFGAIGLLYASAIISIGYSLVFEALKM